MKELWYARDGFIVHMQADNGRRSAMGGVVMKGHWEQEEMEGSTEEKADSRNIQKCPSG